MKIAIIGNGISGLTAAYPLSEDREVVVFEAADYIGGHTSTVDVSRDGTTYPVNTGFIVFNAATYPNFIRLKRRLGVEWQPSQMSFSVKCRKTRLEFSPSNLNSLFIQRRNLLRPSFYRTLLDIFRFKRDSEELLQTEDNRLTLAQDLKAGGYSRTFVEHFIIPMGAAIWSAGLRQFDRFPARYFAQFFENHGSLNVRDQPLWLTIRGGSRRYIEPITRPFKRNLRVNCPVRYFRRRPDHVEVTAAGAAPERFDAAVAATHSNQALTLLADSSEAERRVLGAIRCQENRTVLHTDSSILPKRGAAWASWKYYMPETSPGRVAVTDDMNIPQSLRTPVEFCVSLNLDAHLNPSKVIRTLTYHHPVYCLESPAARSRRAEISGVNRTYFAGAYWGCGFHENDVNSALDVCGHFGKGLP